MMTLLLIVAGVTAGLFVAVVFLTVKVAIHDVTIKELRREP